MDAGSPPAPWPMHRARRDAGRSRRPASSSQDGDSSAESLPPRSPGGRRASRPAVGYRPAPMSTGAQVIVSELERAGVEVAFGLPGVHNLELWKELRSSSIRLVGVRHEQAAAYAADGYARATGNLGVALTTTGPGAANTLGAVGEAWASRSPILVIATDIPSTLRRPGEYRGILHET